MNYAPLTEDERNELDRLRREELESLRIRGNKRNPNAAYEQQDRYTLLSVVALIFSLIFTPVGLVLGILAKREIDKAKVAGKDTLRGRRLAKSAIIISAVSMAVMTLAISISYIVYKREVKFWEASRRVTIAVIESPACTPENRIRYIRELQEDQKPKPPFFLFFLD